MPTEWVAYEDGEFFGSLFPLEKEIHTVVHHSRSANVRLNVRELVAPMLFFWGGADHGALAFAHDATGGGRTKGSCPA